MDSVKIDRKSKSPRREAYHHGDLRRQLIAAAEAIILERGVDGFTLREAARRAGVSPAAPAHHFKDVRGLLTAVAALGFEEFAIVLAAADRRGGADPAERLRCQGEAYVRFALKHPARFQLMFRHDKHDMGDEAFKEVGDSAYDVLERAIRDAVKLGPDEPMTPEAQGLALAFWSIVHGFAHLALGFDLHDQAGERASEQQILEVLLPMMLQNLPVLPPR